MDVTEGVTWKVYGVVKMLETVPVIVLLEASVAEYVKFHGGVPANATVKFAASPSQTVEAPDNTPVIEGETNTETLVVLFVLFTRFEVFPFFVNPLNVAFNAFVVRSNIEVIVVLLPLPIP